MGVCDWSLYQMVVLRSSDIALTNTVNGDLP